ncbi:MAG: biopolymer transporter ExbD [Bacteroidetes bacterium]|nr:MAG: biopolymer transporter ExbD [Bacteroidota bacterium]
MANIDAAAAGNRSQRTPRVDLTPMVDLAFLLITFFIFTTTLSQPKVVGLVMPADGPPTGVAESGAITLIPHKNGVACFLGQPPAPGAPMQQYNYAGAHSIRQALLTIKQQAEAGPKPQPMLMVLIKPAASANFKQVMQVLDEMTIGGFKRYALLPLEPVLATGF